MGRTIYAEERLLEYLHTLGTQDAYSVGLILGQSSAQKDFIVHLARTLPASETKVVEVPVIKLESTPQNNRSNSYLKSIQDIDVKLVADQAKHVTRMLPGGMSILGIFLTGPGDCLHDTQCIQKLRAVLSAIHKDLTANIYLSGISNQDNIILTYNSNTKQYLCKSIEASLGGIFKPADWKFQKKATQWHHLEALIDFDLLFPIPDDTHPQTLKRLLKDIVKKVSDMVDSALIVIEGQSRSPDDLIEVIAKKFYSKKENSEEENTKQILNVGVYLPCAVKQEKTVKVLSCSASMRLMGQLVSRTALHQKASNKEATNAIKQDILRTLVSRLELHWDSVIEEENGSPEENIVLHEPPRRVLVELPGSKVTFSDYLFPGEKPKESVILFKELLDLEVEECQVQDFIEQQVDLTQFYNQNEEKSNLVDINKESSTNSILILYIIGVIVAIIIGIIGILIHLIYSG